MDLVEINPNFKPKIIEEKAAESSLTRGDKSKTVEIASPDHYEGSPLASAKSLMKRKKTNTSSMRNIYKKILL